MIQAKKIPTLLFNSMSNHPSKFSNKHKLDPLWTPFVIKPLPIAFSRRSLKSLYRDLDNCRLICLRATGPARPQTEKNWEGGAVKKLPKPRQASLYSMEPPQLPNLKKSTVSSSIYLLSTCHTYKIIDWQF